MYRLSLPPRSSESPCRPTMLFSCSIHPLPPLKGASPASRANISYVLSPSPLPAYMTADAPCDAYQVMQSQMIGMQSSLDRILSAIQSQNQVMAQGPVYPQGGGSSRDSPVIPGPMPPVRNNVELYNSPGQVDGPSRTRSFPPLPGFAPPVRSRLAYLTSCRDSLTCD